MMEKRLLKIAVLPILVLLVQGCAKNGINVNQSQQNNRGFVKSSSNYKQYSNKQCNQLFDKIKISANKKKESDDAWVVRAIQKDVHTFAKHCEIHEKHTKMVELDGVLTRAKAHLAEQEKREKALGQMANSDNQQVRNMGGIMGMLTGGRAGLQQMADINQKAECDARPWQTKGCYKFVNGRAVRI